MYSNLMNQICSGRLRKITNESRPSRNINKESKIRLGDSMVCFSQANPLNGMVDRLAFYSSGIKSTRLVPTDFDSSSSTQQQSSLPSILVTISEEKK
mmetsp:Transcript_16945/g.34444  ORF Transcript_16945/g.34444 Transcript_16945/m.34444 type:complete len:97 (+) Transcript_16945:3783-4073(+)